MNKQDKLVEKIHRHFPQLSWKDIDVIEQGWDHVVIVLDDKIVFWFPKTLEYRKKLKSEIALLNSLKHRTLAIPRYTYVAKDYSFAGYRKIQGVEFKPWIFRNKFRRIQKEKAASQLAQFLSSLHRIPLIQAKKFGATQVNELKEFNELVTKTNRLVLPKLKKSEQLRVIDYFDEVKQMVKQRHPVVLTHADFTPEHILVKKDYSALAGIIDFSDRQIRDPAIDFGGLWDYGKKFVTMVIENYKGPKDESLLYRSELDYKRFGLWLMADSQLGCDCTFEEGYRRFIQAFHISK